MICMWFYKIKSKRFYYFYTLSYVLRVEFVRFFREVHYFVGLTNQSRAYFSTIYHCAQITTGFFTVFSTLNAKKTAVNVFNNQNQREEFHARNEAGTWDKTWEIPQVPNNGIKSFKPARSLYWFHPFHNPITDVLPSQLSNRKGQFFLFLDFKTFTQKTAGIEEAACP